jgi:NAD(P)-dependent dehydrogenase (short-subunit alcohol dehydrogenase family)
VWDDRKQRRHPAILHRAELTRRAAGAGFSRSAGTADTRPLGVHHGRQARRKVAIVTGAGAASAAASAPPRPGRLSVVVNDLGGSSAGEGADRSPADEVVAEIKKLGSDAVANYDNVASMEGGERMVKQALDTWGRLDILVNNAGILRDRMVFNMAEEEWDAVIAVHLKGHFTVTKHASLVFRQQRSGRIVNTSSESGLGNMGQANYSAAKEGIVGLTRTLALDLGHWRHCQRHPPRAGTGSPSRPNCARRWSARAAPFSATAPRAAAQSAISMMDELKPEMIAPCRLPLHRQGRQHHGRDFIVGGNEVTLMSLPTRERTIYREGGWTLDALDRIFPSTIGAGVKNPMPPQPPKE